MKRPFSGKSSLELQKLKEDVLKTRFERRKARLEIQELSRWYRRPSVLQPVAAIVIGLVTALIGIANGWFSTKLDRLKIEEENVTREIADLKAGRTELNDQINALKNERSTLQRRLADAAVQTDQLALTIKQLEQRADATEKYKTDFKNLQNSLEQASLHAKNVAATLDTSKKESKDGKIVQIGGWEPIDGSKLLGTARKEYELALSRCHGQSLENQDGKPADRPAALPPCPSAERVRVTNGFVYQIYNPPDEFVYYDTNGNRIPPPGF
jgi:DNA repair exonuclease SbcCD ATPase subunit